MYQERTGQRQLFLLLLLLLLLFHWFQFLSYARSLCVHLACLIASDRHVVFSPNWKTYIHNDPVKLSLVKTFYIRGVVQHPNDNHHHHHSRRWSPLRFVHGNKPIQNESAQMARRFLGMLRQNAPTRCAFLHVSVNSQTKRQAEYSNTRCSEQTRVQRTNKNTAHFVSCCSVVALLWRWSSDISCATWMSKNETSSTRIPVRVCFCVLCVEASYQSFGQRLIVSIAAVTFNADHRCHWKCHTSFILCRLFFYQVSLSWIKYTLIMFSMILPLGVEDAKSKWV